MTKEEKSEYMRDYRARKKKEKEDTIQSASSAQASTQAKKVTGVTQPSLRKPRNPKRKPEHYHLKYVKKEYHYVLSRVNPDGSTTYMGTRGRNTPLEFGDVTIDLDWVDKDEPVEKTAE